MMAASPFAEPAQTPAGPSPLQRRWPLLAVVLALHVLADFWIAIVADSDGDDYRIGLVLGVLFAQIALSAVWTAWAPVTFFLRIGGGLLFTGLISLVMASLVLRDDVAPATVALIYSMMFFGQWLLSQIPLWIMRVAFGQRLLRPTETTAQGHRSETQFGLRQLLTLTACVAVLLGAARWLFSPEAVEELRSDWTTLAIIGLLAGFNALIPLPAIWASFASRRAAPIWLVAAAVFAAVVSRAESYVLSLAAGGPGPDDWFFLWVNLPLFLVTVGTLLAFRACGFRLRT